MECWDFNWVSLFEILFEGIKKSPFPFNIPILQWPPGLVVPSLLHQSNRFCPSWALACDGLPLGFSDQPLKDFLNAAFINWTQYDKFLQKESSKCILSKDITSSKPGLCGPTAIRQKTKMVTPLTPTRPGSLATSWSSIAHQWFQPNHKILQLGWWQHV